MMKQKKKLFIIAILSIFFITIIPAFYGTLSAQCNIFYNNNSEKEFLLSDIQWNYKAATSAERHLLRGEGDRNWAKGSIKQNWHDLASPEPGILYRCNINMQRQDKESIAIYLEKVEVADKVFFNGTLIGKTGNASKNSYDYTKGRLYYIPSNLINSGQNSIAIHLSGEAIYNSGIPHLSIVGNSLATKISFLKDVPEILFAFAYILISILIGLFCFAPNQKHNLYLSFFSLSLGSYYLVQTWLGYKAFSSLSFPYTLSRIFLFLLPPLFLQYLLANQKIKAKKYYYSIYSISAILILLVIILPSNPTVFAYLSKINFLLILSVFCFFIYLTWYKGNQKTFAIPHLKLITFTLLFSTFWDATAALAIHNLPKLTPIFFLLLLISVILTIIKSIILFYDEMTANEKELVLVEKRKIKSIYNMSQAFEKHLHGLFVFFKNYSEKKDKRKQKEIKTGFENSIKGLDGLVQDSNYLKQLESGTYISKHSAIALVNFCKHTIQKSLSARKEKKSRIILKVDKEASMITSDDSLLSLALFHILNNALTYTNGKVELNVKKSEDNEIIFEVIDEGPSVEETNMQQIFQKFFRVEGQDENNHHLGVGLTLASLAVQNLQGRLLFNNNHGFFSVLSIIVPE